MSDLNPEHAGAARHDRGTDRSSTQPELQESVRRISGDVARMASDSDFGMYLSAVKESGKRVRTIIYLLLVALVTLWATYRNVMAPSYATTRLQTLHQAAQALLDPANCTADGHTAIAYVNETLFSVNGTANDDTICLDHFIAGTATAGDSEMVRQIRKQIDELIHVRTDNLTLTIPFLGLHMDVDDLGLFSCVTLFILLLILRISIVQETQTMRRANMRAEQYCMSNQELLLMEQVFSLGSASSVTTGSNFFTRWIRRTDFTFVVFCLLMLLPVWAQFQITETTLHAARWTGIVLTHEPLIPREWIRGHWTNLFILLLALFCVRAQWQFTKLLKQIGESVARQEAGQSTCQQAEPSIQDQKQEPEPAAAPA